MASLYKERKKKGRRFRSIELINDETRRSNLLFPVKMKGKNKKKDKRRKMIFRMHTTLYETLDWYPIKALFSLSEIALHLSLFHWFSNLGWKMKKKRKYDALLFFYIVTKYYPLFFPFFFEFKFYISKFNFNSSVQFYSFLTLVNFFFWK